MQKKLESAERSLVQARRAEETHVQQVHELEKSLQDVEERREEYESTLLSESQSQGRSIQLEDEQVENSYYIKRVPEHNNKSH